MSTGRKSLYIRDFRPINIGGELRGVGSMCLSSAPA
jgi:hypothetical protein